MTHATFAVVVFPGSNCDRDCVHALRDELGQRVIEVWHRDSIPANVDCVVIPGGFSYGDALRAGALAALSPVMDSVRRFADAGAPIIGICNGFQALLEARLLPGALLRNRSLRFRCKRVHVRIETAACAFTAGGLSNHDVLSLPIAHSFGAYHLPKDQLAQLESSGQIVLRYCDPTGAVTEDANPNGSVNNIASVMNAQGNMLGLMPHPERASSELLGGADGLKLFRAAIQAVTNTPLASASANGAPA